MAKIAFLGLGQMGAPMAARLLQAGHEPWQPDGDLGCRRNTPALRSTQGVVLLHTFLARR